MKTRYLGLAAVVPFLGQCGPPGCDPDPQVDAEIDWAGNFDIRNGQCSLAAILNIDASDKYDEVHVVLVAERDLDPAPNVYQWQTDETQSPALEEFQLDLPVTGASFFGTPPGTPGLGFLWWDTGVVRFRAALSFLGPDTGSIHRVIYSEPIDTTGNCGDFD